jgi:hypothetical protein
MLSEAKHLLFLPRNNQSRSFAPLRMTSFWGLFSKLLERISLCGKEIKTVEKK